MPICRKSRSHVQHLLDTGQVFQVNMFDLKAGVQFFPVAVSARTLEDMTLEAAVRILSRHGNVLPFARIQDRLRKPHRLHYPIPAVGAHNRPFWVREVNYAPESDSTEATA
jgi:hypothetical protein